MKTFLLLIIFFTKITSLNADVYSDYRYGLYLDYGYNIIDADFRALPGVPSCCPRFTDGDGNSFNIGGKFSYSIFEDKFRVSLRSSFFMSFNDFASIEPVVLSVDNQPYEGDFTHYLDSDNSAVELKPSLEFKLFKNTYFNIGPLFRFINSAEYKQTEKITNPDDRGIFTETGSNVRNNNSGNIQDVSKSQFLISAGLNYSFYLDEEQRYSINPEIGYDYAVNYYIENISWKNSRIRFGITLFYNSEKIKKTEVNIPDPPEIKEPEPVVAEKPKDTVVIPKPLITQNDFEIKAVGVENGVEKPVLVIRSDEFLFFNLKPLLTYVFFDDNSSEIDERYELLESYETDDFKIIDMKKKETLDIYHNVLNIIGRRLTERENSTITVTGCNSNLGNEKSDIELSKSRADAVKNYLTNIWNISPERIEMKSRNLPQVPSNSKRPEGIEENRRAEIYSDDWEIIKPVVIDDTSRSISPPILRFYTKSFANEDALEWKLIVFQDELIIGEFSGKGIPKEKLDVSLESFFKFKSLSKDSISYKFKVKHLLSNDKVEYVGSLPVDSKTIEDLMRENQRNKRIDKYNLILFSYDKSNLNDNNKKIADLINSRISNDASVKVLAYTDRTGSAEYNLQLSKSRAKTAAGVLDADNIITKGHGKSILLYDNDLPEGRFYCRTVEIYVETELK